METRGNSIGGKFLQLLQRRVGLGNVEFIFRIGRQIFNFVRHKGIYRNSFYALILQLAKHICCDQITLLEQHIAAFSEYIFTSHAPFQTLVLKRQGVINLAIRCFDKAVFIYFRK